MTTAFAFTGGASLGAVQVGMLDVLLGAGIRPDLIVGCSVGAINGAWLASHPRATDAEPLGDLWRSIRRRDVFPFSPLRVAWGLAGRIDHTISSAALARWLSVRATFFQLEQAGIPLYVVTTDLLKGTPVVLTRGDVVESLLASAAIPGLFPPVEIDGRWLVDGSLSAATPVGQAVALGADVVYLLPTESAGGVDGIHRRPRSAAGVTLQSIAHLLGQASLSDVRAGAARCQLFVVPPPPAIGVSPFDFRHSAELIGRGRASAAAWLATRQPVPAGV